MIARRLGLPVEMWLPRLARGDVSARTLLADHWRERFGYVEGDWRALINHDETPRIGVPVLR